MLTNKEIYNLVGSIPDDVSDFYTPFARAVIAAHEAKLREQAPVGYFYQEYSGGPVLIYQVNYSHKDHDGVFPLYLHPAPIPEGYALIPLAPTDAILKAIASSTSLEQCYANILAAARSGNNGK